MITGIGLDIVDMERIRALENRHPRFPQRILGKEEWLIYEQLTGVRKTEFLAGRFACKEAFAKASGLGIGKSLSFQDIQIVKEKSGKPAVIASGFSDARILVSITHTKEYAAAQIIMESLSS
ncbi:MULTISPECIES: holo-ACP synthase [Bacillaceae]|uniref:Holo-[acyl-carrier-protein] synthase n=1 Tax=Metabacillus sediminis TaxID=3117746 RepID=A0ABZ2NHG1_9BACI|nr:holo-ACP synthase [Bacillus sp. SJS]KZZ85204.1 holo-ACP synthase [Bacillus sp. SJS]